MYIKAARKRARGTERTVKARATERSGGNVSYAQHVIDPSERFFARGTFAIPCTSWRAREYERASRAKRTKRRRARES